MKLQPIVKSWIALMLLVMAAVTAQGGEPTLEIRLLEFSGDAPDEAMIRMLVDDIGAQVAPGISPKLEWGSARLRPASTYLFASEFKPDGTAANVETRDLGWEGEVALRIGKDGRAMLDFKLSHLRAGPPRIYNVDGVSMMMPVFTRRAATGEGLLLEEGKWGFVPAEGGADPGCFAVRWSAGRE